jgi:15-cis-phytoene synthase
MKPKSSFTIFRQGSRTYFYSSLFFPPKVRQDVFDLYAFVRTADDYVDSVPQKADEFHRFKNQYLEALKGKSVDNPIITNFVALAQTKNFDPTWADAFLAAMESDLNPPTYHTIKDTVNYMYGSAEVIGLMMASIMELPSKAKHAASLLGRSMQYVNFIRDIDEDNNFGRRYFPETELKKYGLNSLHYEEAVKKLDRFTAFIHGQLDYYHQWLAQAKAGFAYIPRRYRIPISTASAMYEWTSGILHRDPLMVYCKKVKPGKSRILKEVLIQSFTL